MREWLEAIVLRITHRMWNRRISRIIGMAYASRVIDSRQMHILSAAFDPTQKHKVYGCGYKTPFYMEYRGSNE